LNYIQGDLLQTSREVIGHCVNNRGGFGSGIAGQIAKKYPHVRKAYLRSYKQGEYSIGKIQLVRVNARQFIANMCMQDTYGGPGIHIVYDAVGEAFTKLIKYCEERKFNIAIPKVGSGLAGGDWNRIAEIIEKIMGNSPVEIDVYYLE
jgi:O-acetyl-ADP-ribose deacetylase (regulator of RNase III)